MFPLQDENPTELTPVVTYIFIAINVAVWLLVQRGVIIIRILLLPAWVLLVYWFVIQLLSSVGLASRTASCIAWTDRRSR